MSPAGERLFLLGLNHVSESAPREPVARAAFVAEAVRRMREWGFNNLGYGTPDEARDALRAHVTPLGLRMLEVPDRMDRLLDKGMLLVFILQAGLWVQAALLVEAGMTGVADCFDRPGSRELKRQQRANRAPINLSRLETSNRIHRSPGRPP